MKISFCDVVGFVQNNHSRTLAWFGNPEAAVWLQTFGSNDTFSEHEKIANIDKCAAVSVRQIAQFGFQYGVLFGRLRTIVLKLSNQDFILCKNFSSLRVGRWKAAVKFVQKHEFFRRRKFVGG